jgi:hypothetical protein
VISYNDGQHYHNYLAKVPNYDHETSREHDETNAHDLCSKAPTAVLSAFQVGDCGSPRGNNEALWTVCKSREKKTT